MTAEPKDDGGPVFPVADLSKCQCAGMSLRDYFAAQVMSDFNFGNPETPPDACAAACYVIADAMLKARNQ